MRASAPRRSRISSTTARYSRSSAADVLVLRLGVLVDGHLDPQRAGGVGVRGAGDAPRHALDHDSGAAAGNAHALHDVGDGADARELAVGARHEQHALLLPGLDSQGGGHAGEEDRVVQGDENQVFHGHLFPSGSVRGAEIDYSDQRFVPNMICR